MKYPRKSKQTALGPFTLNRSSDGSVEKNEMAFWYISTGFAAQEVSHDDIRSAIATQIYSMDNSRWDHYVGPIYDNYFVYVAYSMTDGTEKYYKQNYTVDESGVVAFDGEAVEVRRDVSYVPVNQEMLTDNENQSEKEQIMTICNEKLSAFLKENAFGYTEEDRPMFEAMSQEQFDKLIAVKQHAADVAPEVPAEPKTQEAVVAELPDDVKKTVLWAQKKEAQEKNDLIAVIAANKNNQFTKEELLAFDVEVLEKLSKVARTVNYGVQGAAPSAGMPSAPEKPRIPAPPSIHELYRPKADN